jgi:hypothetical protein
VRTIAFEGNIDRKMPGPGQYNISKELVKPNVEAIVCENNVVFKVNSLGSPVFQSESKRFN